MTQTKAGDVTFCKLLIDTLEEHGYSKDDVVVIVGDGFEKVQGDDPYLCRTIFAIRKFADGKLTDNRVLAVRPESLEVLSDELQQEFSAQLEAGERVEVLN